MRSTSEKSGASVAVSTFLGFFVIVIFSAAVGSYIGRHSTPPREAAPAAVAPEHSSAAPPATAMPAPASPTAPPKP